MRGMGIPNGLWMPVPLLVRWLKRLDARGSFERRSMPWPGFWRHLPPRWLTLTLYTVFWLLPGIAGVIERPGVESVGWMIFAVWWLKQFIRRRGMGLRTRLLLARSGEKPWMGYNSSG